MINARLFQRYGIDVSKNLKLTEHCSRPFDTILIDKQGSCYACECQAWLPQSIGNLQIAPLEKILQSPMRQHLQESIDDGTYRYCNEHQCTYIKTNQFFHGSPTKLKHLRLAIDDSCNLRCPSCRKGLIFHKEGSAFKLGIKLADKINDWLHTYQDPMQVHIGSDGDPFASHIYRYFMENTPRRSNIKYSILTNGLMFKDFHTRISYVIENLKEIGVSIDGASKDTYEKLRLGGNWEKINANLKCIAEQKAKHGFDFNLHFVVQKDNYHEMEDIIELGKEYNVTRVFLNKLEDWNTFSNFTEMDIFNPSHPLHDDYQVQLEKIKPYSKNILQTALF